MGCTTKKLLVLCCCVFLALVNSALTLQGQNSHRLGESLDEKEPIDPNKKYLLGWVVDEENGEITFEVEVETTGYVGFGISPSGSMTGADLFIAGVRDGQRYSGDYHAERNGMPTEDEHSDWMLLNATETEGKTILRFSRPLETCDPQDYTISQDTNRLIWSIGESDELAYHMERGTYSTHLLLPELPFDGDQYMVFDTVVNNTMPPQDTTYWCTVHEGPLLSAKHHIVAFEPYLPSVDAEKYTHHFILYNCYPPGGESGESFFGRYVGSGGNHCYNPAAGEPMPIIHCQEYLYVWAKGGKRMVLPDGIGYPTGEIPGERQYYMLEVHYDNPLEEEGKQFVTGVRTYYTPNLMSVEANLLMIGHEMSHSITVPPDTENFIVAGHCAPICTESFLPEEGVTVFNVLLHSHLSGRKMKLRHFRNGAELPWIDHDDHYDFNYQQNKNLPEFRKILPGDQLTLECNYASTWNTNHEVIVGGISSREEMCEAYIWFYPKHGLDICMSTYPLQQGFLDLGISNITLEPSIGDFGHYFINEPEELRGPYVDSISHKFNWTEEFRETYQAVRRHGVHYSFCRSRTDNEDILGEVQYPETSGDYAPENPCQQRLE